MRTIAVAMMLIVLAITACGDQPSGTPQLGQSSPSATTPSASPPDSSPTPSASPAPILTATVVATPPLTPTNGPTPTTPIATWGNDELYVIDLATLTESRLTANRPFDGQPTWSPDGAQIAFTRSAEQYGPNALFLIDATGGDPRPLITIERYIHAPAWSPDGTRIAYMAEGWRGYEIWIVNADGSDAHPLVPIEEDELKDPLTYSDPTWSPDGAQIAFSITTQYPWSNHLWVINSDGTDLRQLTATEDDDMSPAWSPDGTSIAFTRLTKDDYEHHLYVMDADGSNQRPLLDDGTQGSDPAWSPDGARIAYVRGLDNRSDIFILDLATGEKRQLTITEYGEYEPAWSPDGSQIAYRSNRDGGHPIDCSWHMIADYAWFGTVADLVRASHISVAVTAGNQQPPVFGPTQESGSGESRRIYTDTIVYADEYLFRELTDAGTLRIREEGGEIGDCEQTVSPTAELVTDQRYLLFLQRDSYTSLPDGWLVVGGNQGVLTINADDTVSAPQYSEIDGLPLTDVIAIIQSHAR